LSTLIRERLREERKDRDGGRHLVWSGEKGDRQKRQEQRRRRRKINKEKSPLSN
jgi:hypothetical protein